MVELEKDLIVGDARPVPSLRIIQDEKVQISAKNVEEV
jgi:hypothetical protein